MFLNTFKLLALCVLLFPLPVVSYTYYRDTEACDLVGDGDIYGVGMRLSIYIQCFTAIFTLLGTGPENLRTLRLSFNTTATAIAFNFLRDNYRSGFLYLEYWIIFGLLQFFLWIFNWASLHVIVKGIAAANESQSHGQESLPTSSNLMTQRDQKVTKEEFWEKLSQSIGDLDYFSIAWTLLISSILLVTQTWLFSKGLKTGHPSGCREVINLYVHIDIHNEDSTRFVFICSVIATIWLIPIAVIFFILSLTLGCFFELERIQVKELPGEPDRLSSSTKLQNRLAKALAPVSALVRGSDWLYNCLRIITSLPLLFNPAYVYLLLGLFALLSGIFWTEKTIQVNNIDLSATTFSSSGQLIAILASIFTSVPTLWTVFLAFFKKWAEEIFDNLEQKQAGESVDNPEQPTLRTICLEFFEKRARKSVDNRKHENGTTDETTNGTD